MSLVALRTRAGLHRRKQRGRGVSLRKPAEISRENELVLARPDCALNSFDVSFVGGHLDLGDTATRQTARPLSRASSRRIP